jgi:hypothetical protein
MTDLSPIADEVVGLASTVEDVCRVVQGVIVHPFWAERYGVTGAEARDDELQIREAAGILGKALSIDSRPLIESREPAKRVLGNCRDFTTVGVALMRHAGIPARGRCGFGAYFDPGKFIDHWVMEWWNGRSWVLTDAQLDPFQVKELSATFDPLDVPREVFVDAGRAWGMYRAGEVDGGLFGILDMWGPWFIRGNVSRDIASLNKVEMLPWDAWGIDLAAPPPEEHTDEVARVAAAAKFDDVRALYERDEIVRVPEVITSFTPNGPVTVKL